MTTRAAQGSGRLAKIRLSDVPLNVRLRAARRVVDSLVLDGGMSALVKAAEVQRAAERPSDREYLVSEESIRKVLRRA